MPFFERMGPASRLVLVLLLAVPAYMFLYQTTWAANRFQYDDSFIIYRIAKNIAHGIGPYFNAGSPERTNTSILHIYLLAPLFRLPDQAAIEATAWLDIAVFLATVALASAGLASLVHRRFGIRPEAPFVLTFLLLVSRLSIMYGMETQVYCLLIMGVFFMATRPGLQPWAFAVSCLGPFIRPDGVLLPAVVLAGVMLFQGRQFNYRRHLAIGAALAAVYIVLNLAWYGTLMPHTAQVKSLLFRDKWKELQTFASEFLVPHNIPSYLVVFALPGLVLALRDRAGFILGAFLILYSAFFTAFNTWFFPWYRVPVQVILDVCAALGFAWAYSLAAKAVKDRPALRTAAAAGAVLFCGLYFYKSLDDAQRYLKLKVLGFDRRVKVSYIIGNYLKAHVPPGKAVFLEPLGIIGFYAWPVPFRDFPGLASQEAYQCLKAYGPGPTFFYEANADQFFHLAACIPGISHTVLREREYRNLKPYLDPALARPRLTVYGLGVNEVNDTYYRIFRTEDLLKARRARPD